MKKLLVILAAVCFAFGFAGTAHATLVTFDFNAPALLANSNAAAIGTYMSTLYGSTVTVIGAESSPTNEGDLLGPDGHIENATVGGQGVIHGFRIQFADPISSVEFDWAREQDLTFHAEADGVEFFLNNTPSNNQNVSGHLSTYTFASPVYELYFHDNWTGETEIDNLIVNKIDPVATPEPASLVLLGMGALGLFGIKRRKA
ncbi:MAG: PEP-CTERM sorting domain-containing protein [Candidatus Omnitrophota bacterium]